MKTYCDVLQTKGSDGVLKIEVLRYDTQEVLEGELNGRPLVKSFSFAEDLGDQVANEPSGGPAYDSYVQVNNDSGLLTFEVPASWDDVNGANTEDGDPAVSASPDLDAYFGGWDVPGVIFIASADYAAQTDDQVLDLFSGGQCTSAGRKPYQDALYSGTFEFFTDCGGTDTARAIVVARPPDNPFAAVIDMQLVTEADLEALDRVMNTFIVNFGADTGGN